MLETLTDWLILYKDIAPYAVFFLLLLAGCSIPISEDVLIIASGVLAGSSLPEKTVSLFLAAFLGSYLSDWIAYWMGRYVARRASKNGRCFGIPISRDFTKRFEGYFEKWGLLTLMIGRMIPFGFRNGIFMTAGAGRMPFYRFLISDGISCLIFSSVVFWLSFHAGTGSGGEGVEAWLSRIGLITLLVVSCGASFFLLRSFRSKKGMSRVQ